MTTYASIGAIEAATTGVVANYRITADWKAEFVEAVVEALRAECFDIVDPEDYALSSVDGIVAGRGDNASEVVALGIDADDHDEVMNKIECVGEQVGVRIQAAIEAAKNAIKRIE